MIVTSLAPPLTLQHSVSPVTSSSFNSYRCKWHDANSFIENDQALRSAIWVVLPAKEDKFIWTTSYSYSGEAPQLMNLSTWILNWLSLHQSFVRTSWLGSVRRKRNVEGIMRCRWWVWISSVWIRVRGAFCRVRPESVISIVFVSF